MSDSQLKDRYNSKYNLRQNIDIRLIYKYKTYE